MSERVIRDGIGIALALAFCVSAAVGLEAKSPVVVTGLYSASWLKWAKEEKILAEAAAWETECPVAALEGRHLVVFAYAKPKTPLTPQENAAIHKWLEQGGMLILTSGSPAAIAGKTDLSALTWLGANQYVYGKVQNTMLTPENPLVKGMAEDALKATEFCSNQPNLGSLTTAAALIGTDKTANVLLNRVGKGWVLFVSMPPFLGQKSAEGGPALRAIVERFVKAALGGTEEREALARGMPDLKRPAVRVRGRDRVACIVTEQAGAGQRLAKLIEQMTGARAPVVKTPPSGDPFCIHVGPTEFAKRHDLPPQGLHPFGYVFKLVDADNLVIAPARPNVADHAALMFLHRYAGYRWFAPGELGEVIPKVATIALPDRIDDRVEPSFTSWVNA
ncbi:MAG: hypothetical protein FJ278_22475, partial [Planctomycetes bacterium]|nr:hypothetical protein [Planctomycetota bacterium]